MIYTLFYNCQLFCAVAWNSFLLLFIVERKGGLTAAASRHPSIHPSLLSLRSGESYFQLCLCGTADVCSVFHLLLCHFASYPERRGFKGVLHGQHARACTSVCVFCLLWALGACFYFPSCFEKRILFAFASVLFPCTQTACPDKPK